ncbi:hypothetical protein NHX12_011174 [Muraenolepis orangiensis]|uniref:Ig-like domain-containing protein n=1 Tax=Muraenolepis orangiensis TaxID=630683 RepID=A0A9Q0I5F5_9TELE|nr:hypothetical protein NHX12_011174 [Muraenolepis orangiensis]
MTASLCDSAPLALLLLYVLDGCIDWSVDLKRYRVLSGEPVKVKCALFYSYIRTNYTMATNAKLRLIWYKNKGDSEVRRNSTYCMKVSMSMTVVDSDEGRCFSSQIRHLEKAEITRSKMITCPDITDYMAPYKQPTMTCFLCFDAWFPSRLVSLTPGFPHAWFPPRLVSLTPGFPHAWFPPRLVSLTPGFPHAWFPSRLVSPTPGFPHAWFPSHLVSLLIDAHQHR